MFIQLLFLTLALSIDSLGIGVSYGVRKIKFGQFSFFIISLISLAFSSLSLSIGSVISIIFSEKITSFISILILIILGLFIIKKGLEKNEETKNNLLEPIKDKKIFSCFIKSLGITINVIKTPSSCDLDNSMKIEPKEAFYLGIALSIDCIGVGIAVSSLKIYAHLFPLFIMFFQLLFLYLGTFIGSKLKLKKLDETRLSVLSGIILILIGGIRIILS